MISKSIQNTIKSTVHSLLPDARVLLFGSMARGDANADSDYDVLVITQQTFLPRERLAMSTKVNNALVDVLKAPVDVILNSVEQINDNKDLLGHIVHYALMESVEL